MDKNCYSKSITLKDIDDCCHKNNCTTKLPIALLNGAVVTTNGLYRISDISVQEARDLLYQNNFVSAIGHKTTAQILSELLKIPIQMNRIEFQQQIGQKAIVFKLNRRSPEGSILSKQEIEEIGYSLKLMDRLE